jgi:aminomethyltransferase
MSDEKKTPLFEVYKDKAKMVSFYGWLMPVYFLGIMAEHHAVRTKAGLFDVSHMGELEIEGLDALALIQKLTTNDISKLNIGEAQYSVMCYLDGGTVDDLLIYRLEEMKYLLVVNASNIIKDEEWIRQHQFGDVKVNNISEQIAMLALQGPLAGSLLQKITEVDLSKIKPFTFQQAVNIAGIKVLVSRTGYTGEDGFELYLNRDCAIDLWNELLKVGSPDGLLPCGLGARDTLRLESKLPLYGQELSEKISPIEAGVGFVVKHDKGDFFGRDVLIKQKQEGAPRKLVGIEMIERGIPRSNYPVFKENRQIGQITSGTYSPTLNKNVGLALVETDYARLDDRVEVEIRGKRLQAQIVKTPFYRRGE